MIDWEVQLNLICECMTQLSCLRLTIASPDITSVRAIASLKQLRTLFLSVWSAVSLDADVIEILKSCSQLRSLTVNGEVTDTSLTHLSSCCPKLQRLEVALNASPTGITDETLEVGLSRLADLRHLSLRNCDVTDAAFARLLTYCPRLSFVRLSVAKRLTLASVAAAQEHAIRLTRLLMKNAKPSKGRVFRIDDYETTAEYVQQLLGYDIPERKLFPKPEEQEEEEEYDGVKGREDELPWKRKQIDTEDGEDDE